LSLAGQLQPIFISWRRRYDAFEDLYYAGPLQDVYNLQQERHTISSFDQTHIVKGYVVYELPFGRGKSLLLTRGLR
jgi:hypothetical protein